MGWIKKVPPPHACSLPFVVDYDIGRGSVWECPCGRQYEYTGEKSDCFGYHYPEWEELIP